MLNSVLTKTEQIALVKEWITDLRNPENKQIHGQLKKLLNDEPGFAAAHIYGYCCLGLLCEIAVEHDLLVKKNNNDYAQNGYILHTSLENFRYTIGLEDREEQKLIRLNDGLHNERQHTFPEIAEYIEKNILPRMQAELETFEASKPTESQV